MARLNAVELDAMSSRTRKASLRFYELPTFERMLRRAKIDLVGKRVLDAGCGPGYGTSLLAQRFQPSRLVGFDLMPEQIERARRLDLPDVELRVGDVTHIGEREGSFDAVFVFGILHHVPQWRIALDELARVLTDRGVLLIEEIHGPGAAFEDRYLGTEHPKEAFFDWDTFRMELGARFEILDETALLSDFARSFLARKRT